MSGSIVGQSPEVAWDGHEALVTFDTPGQGVRLAAVADDGKVSWTEPLPGTNARVAWNARTHTGMVVTSETIAWLGRDGKPVHRTSAPHVTNVSFEGAPFPTEHGFLLATGVASHASNATPMPFSVATVGAPADAISWKRVADDGLRGAPIGGPSGAVAWMISQPRQAAAQLFSVSVAGELGAPVTLPNAPGERATALAVDRDGPVVLFADDVTHELSTVAVHGATARAPARLGVRSTRSDTAVFLRLGDGLYLGADMIGESPGVALAPFDASAPRVGAALAIGPEHSQHLRVAPTDTGFVAAWNIADDDAPRVMLANHASMHGLSAMLAIYACCPEHVPHR